MIAGYALDRYANALQYNRLFQEVLKQEQLSSQFMMPTLLHTLNEENINQLLQVTKKLGDLDMDQQNTQYLVLDLDSTSCPTYDKQEEAEFIYHYGINGYHPFVAFEALTGLALDVRHRHGKSYTSTHTEDYFVEMLERYQQCSSDPTMLVRGDSGFAKPENYKTCERRSAHYVIKLKNNARLVEQTQRFVQHTNGTDYTKTEQQYFKINYRADSWFEARTVSIKATRKAEALLFLEFQFVVTDFSNLSPQTIFQLYQK